MDPIPIKNGIKIIARQKEENGVMDTCGFDVVLVVDKKDHYISTGVHSKAAQEITAMLLEFRDPMSSAWETNQ